VGSLWPCGFQINLNAAAIGSHLNSRHARSVNTSDWGGEMNAIRKSRFGQRRHAQTTLRQADEGLLAPPRPPPALVVARPEHLTPTVWRCHTRASANRPPKVSRAPSPVVKQNSPTPRKSVATEQTYQAAFADINGDGFLDLVYGGKVWINMLGQ